MKWKQETTHFVSLHRREMFVRLNRVTMSPVESSLIFIIMIIALMTIHLMTGPRVGFTNYVPVLTPDDASLDSPRKPYHLLEWLPNASSGNISCLKSSCCSETDFMSRTNLTGNYLQRTNNYRHAYPDNCSAPFHELTLSFYKPTLL